MDPHRFDQISKLFAQRRLSRRHAVAGGVGLAAGLAALGRGVPGAAAADLAGVPGGPPAAATPAAGTPGFAMLATPTPGGTALAAPPTTATKPTTFLFLQSFAAGSLVPQPGNPGHFTLTLEQGLGETVYFSDRPTRIVGTLPTPGFLAGLGFPPTNPPNAALVGQRSPTHTDVVVVELFNPRYDTTTNTAIYDVTLLQDWHKLDETFQDTPDAEQQVPRQFTAAQLFIDDCADGDIACVTNDETRIGPLQAQGFCYNWWAWACEPCQDYSPQCNATFPACHGQGHAFQCYSAYGGGLYCG